MVIFSKRFTFLTAYYLSVLRKLCCVELRIVIQLWRTHWKNSKMFRRPISRNAQNRLRANAFFCDFFAKICPIHIRPILRWSAWNSASFTYKISHIDLKMAFQDFFSNFAPGIHVLGRNARTLCPICPNLILLESEDSDGHFEYPQP